MLGDREMDKWTHKISLIKRILEKSTKNNGKCTIT